MDMYDSDSSLSDAESGVSTNVLLGYASKEATDDLFSQLGGEPAWLDQSQPPPSTLSNCLSCNSLLTLLLQLDGDLPERFPGHRRALYILSCRRKACRRKPGSVRAFRGVRIDKCQQVQKDEVVIDTDIASSTSKPDEQEKVDVGAALFGAGAAKPASGSNPFAKSSSNAEARTANPFATAPDTTTSLAAKSPQPPSSTATLSATFAEKARISAPQNSPAQPAPTCKTHPWPPRTAFPAPYPSYSLDAEHEYLTSQPAPSNGTTSTFLDTSTDTTNADSAGATSAEDSAHDKTFQTFADRLAQNPEQVLRYDFGGAPLLYSRTDVVGRIFAPNGGHATGDGKIGTLATHEPAARIPRCENCGASRVFELQLTPHAIYELERDEEDAGLEEGMEWGTILLGVCSRDCSGAGAADEGEGGDDAVTYVEEWAGVQWEEAVASRGPVTASASSSGGPVAGSGKGKS